MILAKKQPDGGYAILSGHQRLQAELNSHGHASLLDADTNEQLVVHEIGGKLVALTEGAATALEAAAADVIAQASRLGA